MIQFRVEDSAIVKGIAAKFDKCAKKKVTNVMRRDALKLTADHIELINSCVQEFKVHPEVQPAVDCINMYALEFRSKKDNGYHWNAVLTDRPRMGAPSFIDELRRFSQLVVTKLPPLTDQENVVMRLIQEEMPILGKQIAWKLDINEDWVRQLCRPKGKLGVHGVVNYRDGEGYRYQQPM